MFLLGWFFLLRPQWQKYRSLPDPATYAAAKLSVNEQIATLSELKAEYGKLTATDFTRLDLFLPKGKDIPNLLAQLEGLAEFTGFEIESLGLADAPQDAQESRVVRDSQGEVVGVNLGEQGAASGPELKELQLTLTLGPGTYEQLKKFIAATEESLRAMTLTSLTFTSKSSQQSVGFTGFNLNLKSPYLR